MGAGLSSKFLELRRRYRRWELQGWMGMEERLVELDDGSTMIHCWVPRGWGARSAGAAGARAGARNDNTEERVRAAGATAGRMDNTEEKLVRAAAGGLKDTRDHDGNIKVVAGEEKDHDREEKRGGDDGDREEKRNDDDCDDKVVVLLHGFGAEGMAWAAQVPALRARGCQVFIPDLLFFGGSSTRRGERSEAFQAECVVAALRRLGVRRAAAVVGHSYGGFVAYRMAHVHPRFVRRVVLVSSGVAMNPRSNDALLAKACAPSIEHVLVPPTVQAFSTTLSLICHPHPPYAPAYLHPAMHKLMQGDAQRRLELAHGIILGKENAPPLPKLEQDVLIIWGDQDQIFDVQLAHELKEFLQPKAKLIIFKEVGHAPIILMREFNQKIIEFLER